MATLSMNFHAAGLFDILRRRRSPRLSPVEPIRASTSATSPMPGREVRQRRAEAMRGFFPKLSAWMAKRSYLAEMSSVDRYLSQATDLFDLECRIREVERGGSAARWY